MSTVIDTDRTALRSAFFEEINAYTIATANNIRGVDTEIPQRVYCGLSDRMGGKFCDISTVQTEIRQRDSNICFPAAEGCLHDVILEKAVISVGGKAEHDLSECDYFFHDYSSIFSRASFTKKLPPMAAILSNAKNSSILLLSTPPVGMNLTCGKGAERALRAFKPP